MKHSRGVTLIELLMVVIIASIGMFALVPPLLAEGQLFRKGKRQTEAQRDAQIALRAIARVARESTGYELQVSTPGYTVIRFFRPSGTVQCFRGGTSPPPPNAPFSLIVGPACEFHPSHTVLIDGVRSRVQTFAVTPVPPAPSSLFRIQLNVSHRLRGDPNPDPFSEVEQLETEIFLRNAT